MLMFQSILLCLLAGYFFGGLSGGHLVGKLYKTDVRQHGSGNMGATNVLRVLGKKAGAMTLAIDLGKVIIPILIVRYLLFPQYPAFTYENQLLVLYLALGTVIGHNFPIGLEFRGGKGVACMGAVMLMFDWRLAVIGLLTFVLIVAITRYVSLASMFESLFFVAWVALAVDSDLHMILVTCMFPVLVIFMHRTNIKRLINGTENKIGAKKR